MANKSFKTPGTMHLEMEAERKAADIKTAIRSFQTALDQDQDNASVAGSISTTEEHNFFLMQTDVEKNAPWLAEATKENVRVFIQAFKKYRDEDNGIRQMTALVRTETRTVLCEHFLKISVQDFYRWKMKNAFNA